MDQKCTVIRKGQYSIECSASEPLPSELRPTVHKISNAITWSLWMVYSLSQAFIVYWVQMRSSSLMWEVCILVFAEAALSFQQAVVAINILTGLFAGAETTRPSYRLAGCLAPTIDVFITCCGENTDVVLDTVAATMAQNYPPERFRVLVLDDGHDQSLQEAVQLLATKSSESGSQLYYLARIVKPGCRSYYKAGNLQHGIEHTQRLGPSEYIASLDADMIPEPGWLRLMVSHFIMNDELAIACPAQNYYNVSSCDILSQQTDLDVQATILEPLNDRLDAAMCYGSGFLVRRVALDQIWGWPLVDAGEDAMCSACLLNAGWKSAFVRGIMQRGLAPDSFRAHIKQRTRWADCNIELHRQFGYYFPTSKISHHVAWTARAAAILLACRDHASITNLLALILLPMAYISIMLRKPSELPLSDDYFWLRCLWLANFTAQKINNYVVYNHIGLSRLTNWQGMDIWCTPYLASRYILSLLPFTTNTLIYEPSGCIVSPHKERSSRWRSSLVNRLLNLDMLMFSSYLLYSTFPLLLIVLGRSSAYVTTEVYYVFLGPTIKLLDVTWMASLPLRYMIWPPTVPERDTLIEIDKTGVRRPKVGIAETEPVISICSGLDILEISFICWLFLWR